MKNMGSKSRMSVEFGQMVGKTISEFMSDAINLAMRCNQNSMPSVRQYANESCELAMKACDNLKEIYDSMRGKRNHHAKKKPEEQNKQAVEVINADEKYPGPGKSYGRNVTTVAKASKLLITLNGSYIDGKTAKMMFVNTIEKIGAKKVNDVCKNNDIKLNRWYPLDRDKKNMPNPECAVKIKNGWFVQGHSSNIQKVKTLRRIASAMNLNLEVEMVEP